MKKSPYRTWLFYGLMLVLFAVFTYILFQKAKAFQLPQNVIAQNEAINKIDPSIGNFDVFKMSIMHNVAEPAAMLLLQIISILIVSRIFGYLFAKIGQPTVIGEILAGIVLGPSLLGYFYPQAFHFLFEPNSLGNLYILSQVGLILFMFTIGMELNIGELKEKMGRIYVISHASIIIPYFCGMLLAYFVFEEFAIGRTNFVSAA